MIGIAQDFRYGFRQIRRSPGFFAVTILLIAVGIAATTQIFTLVDVLLLRPLPIRNPQNLVQLFERQANRPADPFFGYRFYQELANRSSTLFEVAGQTETARALERNGFTERVHTVAVTENYFRDLGVTPLLGRVISRNDSHTIVLSYNYWCHSFGSDPKVLGQMVRLQGHAYTIVGVTPEAFAGTTVDSSPDLWLPFANLIDLSQTHPSSLDYFVTEIIARLRPGISEAQAQQETAAFWNRYTQEAALKTPDNYKGLSRGKLEVQSIARGRSPLRDQSKTALVLLLAGTGLLLLVVCANVGGLLVSRATARERDTAVRLALGASKNRIFRQWLVECFLLATAGGCAGVLIAYAGMPLITRLIPPSHGMGIDPAEVRTLTLPISLDFRIVVFSLFACGVTTLLCAAAPAWKFAHSSINSALKSAGSERHNFSFQSVLCGFQVALCMTILICAGLVIRSLSNLRATNAGFDGEHVTIFSIDPHVRGYDSRKTWSLQQRLLSGARNLPGVENAALANRALMRGIGFGNSVVFPGQRGGTVNTSFNSVSPDYFAVMGIRFLAGRNFGPTEISEEGKLNKVVVNEAFVRKFLNGQNALGKKFDTGRRFVKPFYEIVGIVNDTKYRSLREVPPPIYYANDFGPYSYPESFILHVRTTGDPRAIIEPVRRLLRSLDPEVPLYQVATLSQEIDRSLWQERLLVALTSCFGLFALLLSTIGIYGALAYFVTRQQREIGIRMALGANSRHIIRFVVSRVVLVLVMGIPAGFALSVFANVWVRSFIYGVQPFDPAIIIAAISILIVMAAGSVAMPAFRAIRVDPASTLRQE